MSEEKTDLKTNGSEDGLKKEIEKIWKRARINSFAHRSANELYYKKESNYYVISISTSLASILFIILSNIQDFKCISTYLSLISIIFGFWSLYITIISNHHRYGIRSEEHKHTQNSYLYIAQRTRLSKKPYISKEELLNLYEDLERDFSLIKVRGNEPTDEQFEEAHKLFKKRDQDPTSLEAQSFNSKNKENTNNP